LTLRFLPNLLCVLRMLLAVPVAWLLLEREYQATLWIFAFAALTDGLDGALAKRFGWTSELGKVLDPLADKLLLVTAFVMLTVIDLVPVWLTAAVVLRDVVIGSGAWIYKARFGPLQGQPTPVSKANTVCQILYVLAVVATAGTGWPGTVSELALGTLTFVTTAVSGIDYTLIYSQRAAAVARARRLP